MNKRIKELAVEARLLTGWPVGEVEYQKFAELIILECAEINKQELAFNALERLLNRYEDHFGDR
jgi:hypothetical protein